jgi:hypothetical protein
LSSFSIFSREYIVGGLHIISVSILVGGFWIFYLNSLTKIWNCDFQDAWKL